ncbi:MAG: hypothetical protein ACRD5L_09235 [Bryobacteraceae bacterium]
MLRWLIPLLAALPVSAQTLQTTWGMTPAQVKAVESGQPTEVQGGLQYASPDTRLVYIFAKNKLVRARFTFRAEHGELNDFIRDFQAVETSLAQKYGKPIGDRAIWTDDSTQDEPKSYLDQDRATATGILPSDRAVGLAVSLGHLKMYTEWAAGQTKIRHTLTGAAGHVTHQLEFLSADLDW